MKSKPPGTGIRKVNGLAGLENRTSLPKKRLEISQASASILDIQKADQRPYLAAFHNRRSRSGCARGFCQMLIESSEFHPRVFDISRAAAI